MILGYTNDIPVILAVSMNGGIHAFDNGPLKVSAGVPRAEHQMFEDLGVKNGRPHLQHESFIVRNHPCLGVLYCEKPPFGQPRTRRALTFPVS